MATEPKEPKEESSVDRTGKLLTTLFKVPKDEIDAKKSVKDDPEEDD
jgi:hypothetical protein